MNKAQQTAMWNQGYNIDSGIQTAAPSVKDYNYEEVQSHHSWQFEWEQGFQHGGDQMDMTNEQFVSTRRY